MFRLWHSKRFKVKFMLYFAMPLSVSFAHIKRQTRLLLLLLLKFCTFKCLFSLYMHIAQLQQHWKYLFSTQKRPLSTPKNTTAKCNFSFFQILLSIFTFFHSLNFAHSNGIRQAQGKHIQTCAHTQTRTQKYFSLSMSLSLSRCEKLSLGGGRKRQQRERKYKCSANGFCGDVTVASVGDRWKR